MTYYHRKEEAKEAAEQLRQGNPLPTPGPAVLVSPDKKKMSTKKKGPFDKHGPKWLIHRALCNGHTTLETIHHFVEVLDRYFGNVCELDLIFNFHKAYHILDELLITGELQEPSKKAILRVTAAQDALMEGSGDSKVSDSKYEI